MQEINAWLNSDQDFKTGSALYEKYGTNSFFKKVLVSQGATPYNVKKLEAELKQLAPAPPATPSIDKTKPRIVDAPPAQSMPAEQDTPVMPPNPKEYERYLGLKKELKQSYNQVQRLMAILDLSDHQPTLRSSAAQIVLLNDRIVDLYGKIDFYDKNGHLPETVIIETPIVSPEKELQLLYSSTSRAETRLKSPKCRDRNKTALLIAEKKARIKQLKERIANDID